LHFCQEGAYGRRSGVRNAMGDRVFDVIGQLLQLNDIRFEALVREATYTKAKLVFHPLLLWCRTNIIQMYLFFLN
jgi:hypothetical protein